MTSEIQPTSTRNPTADLLKGIAVVLMIQVHLVELFATEEVFNSPLGSLLLFLGGPPAAPVFMIVMGYFIAHSKKSLQQNIIRGLKLIALGLLLNVGINIHLFIKIFSGALQLDPLNYLFGADILHLAGLSIIVIVCIRKLLAENLIAHILLMAIVILFSEYLNRLDDSQIPLAYLQAFFYGHIQWSYFPLFPWLVYPLAGIVFKLASDKIVLTESLINLIVIPACLISVSTIYYGVEIASSLKEYYHHNWIYILWNFQFMIIMSYIAYKTIHYTNENIIVRYLRWVGRNVTVVYVIQWIIIGNIATALFRTQNELMLLIWFVVILSAVSFLTYLFSNDKSLA